MLRTVLGSSDRITAKPLPASAILHLFPRAIHFTPPAWLSYRDVFLKLVIPEIELPHNGYLLAKRKEGSGRYSTSFRPSRFLQLHFGRA